LYVQNVAAKELLAVLQEISGEQDPKVKSKGRRAAFENVSVGTMLPSDRDQFAKLLGLDASTLELRPVDELNRPFKGQGGARSEAGPPKRTIEERAGVVVADYQSASARHLSPEVRQFFESRRDRHAGSLYTVIYVRELNEK